jgi:hypothetical protein
VIGFQRVELGKQIRPRDSVSRISCQKYQQVEIGVSHFDRYVPHFDHVTSRMNDQVPYPDHLVVLRFGARIPPQMAPDTGCQDGGPDGFGKVIVRSDL